MPKKHYARTSRSIRGRRPWAGSQGALDQLRKADCDVEAEEEKAATERPGWQVPVKTSATFPARATIWDLDDTICKTPQYDAWAETFAEASVQGFTPQTYARYVAGRPVEEGLTTFLEAQGIQLPPSRLQQLAAIKRSRINALIEQHGVEAYSSSAHLLEALKQRGVRIAVVSSNANAPQILERCYVRDVHGNRVPASILQIVDIIVADRLVTSSRGTSSMPRLRGKPAPDSVLKACEELGIQPQETLGFEDAVAGIRAFVAAGVPCIGLDRTGIRDELVAAGALAVFADLAETTIDELADLYRQHRQQRMPR